VQRPPLLVNILCSHNGAPSVGRFVWNGRTYELVGASRQRPGSVLPDEGGKRAKGSFDVSPNYRGCPNCGANNFVQCAQCRTLGCWDESWPVFTCAKCGNRGPVEGTIDRIAGLGSG
jgi:predicted RNA-binding Zn-ribbon protein involved in translation (DUF1610 family)